MTNRDINTPEEVQDFLSDDNGKWHDPFLYNDMHKAVDLINEIMDKGGKILVYGDYDCDGVTATSILVRYFRHHGCNVSYLVPHRAEHGYGLTEKIMGKVIEESPDLVITVDCGITNVDTVSELKERGIHVIVSDHHNVKDEIPNADCVICAKREDNTYPFTELCGAGVALKIVEALGRDGRHKVTPALWHQTIELAGLATIADLVSVTDENRTIIKKAFKSMANPANVGLKAMNDKLLTRGKNLDETFISFNYVPRINAAGRLYDSSDALRLFLENNITQAGIAVDDLTRENEERKTIESKVYEEACAQLENPNRPSKWALTKLQGPIVVYGKDWHQGVLGIVAGKLSQTYRRSAIVFTDDTIDPECVKGSGRAYGSFDLFGALTNISDKLVNFGGHKKAAGMMVRKKALGEFLDALEAEAVRLKEASESIEETDAIEIDCELKTDMVSFATYEEICRLRPFGIGNSKPVFKTSDLLITGIYSMSDGAHIRLDLTDSNNPKSGKTLSAVGFGMGSYLDLLKVGDIIDICYTMNEFCVRGDTTLSLHMEDIHPHFEDRFIWQKAGIAEKLYMSGLGIDQIVKMSKESDPSKDLIPTSEQFKASYITLNKFCSKGMSTADCNLLAKLVNVNTGVTITPFQIKRCLEIFAECGLLSLGSVNPTRLCFSLLEATGKPKLTEAETYKRLTGYGQV
ncbi:MAG: single-stranded-DNA-specific exonuclease RecJ [Saccharofermentans sp.]|nr:single-stranded-DNA-specific exonuclease RecJ [Saccharofermentans sp.]